MASRESALVDITPEVLLKAYACGIFPMAESADDPALYWIEPERRGVIPLDRFHVPSRLARTVRSAPVDESHSFREVKSRTNGVEETDRTSRARHVRRPVHNLTRL